MTRWVNSAVWHLDFELCHLKHVFHALGGGVDSDADFGSGFLGGYFNGPDGIVVVKRVVMVQEEVFDVSRFGFFESPFPSGMAPAFVGNGADAVVFVVGVLGVVEDDVGVFDQLLDIGVQVIEVFGVGGEGEDFDGLAGDVFFDAVAVTSAGVIEGARRDDQLARSRGDLDNSVIIEIAEIHFRRHVLEFDREIKVLLLAAEGFFEDATDEARSGAEAGSVKVELITGFEGGEEKGEALNVVPVDMAEEKSGLHGFFAPRQLQSQQTEAGAAVDDDEASTGFDGNAGGIAPVTGGDK